MFWLEQFAQNFANAMTVTIQFRMKRLNRMNVMRRVTPVMKIMNEFIVLKPCIDCPFLNKNGDLLSYVCKID